MTCRETRWKASHKGGRQESKPQTVPLRFVALRKAVEYHFVQVFPVYTTCLGSSQASFWFVVALFRSFRIFDRRSKLVLDPPSFTT